MNAEKHVQEEPAQRGGEKHIAGTWPIPCSHATEAGESTAREKEPQRDSQQEYRRKGQWKGCLRVLTSAPPWQPSLPGFCFSLLCLVAACFGQQCWAGQESSRHRAKGFLWLSGKLHGVRGSLGLSGSSKARVAPGGGQVRERSVV